MYSATIQGAIKLQADLLKFTQEPTEANLKIAKATWTEVRKIYSQTEIYRFYGGPIDATDSGPEGLINSWPLDEIYIDDIIARADLYPELNIETIRSLNEKDGEKNISTGWHAIEYLLWGKDESTTGPGARPASDYAQTNPLAARRAQYLNTIAEALLADLESVRVQWDLSNQESYGFKFLTDKDSLLNMLIGVTKMSGAELSQERMIVPLDRHDQEEEHSCFSDTTHFDIIYNFIGIKNVMAHVLPLIKAKDKAVAAEIEDAIQVAEDAVNAIPAPFDQAIADGNKEGNARVFDAVEALQNLTETIRQGAVTIGVKVP